MRYGVSVLLLVFSLICTAQDQGTFRYSADTLALDMDFKHPEKNVFFLGEFHGIRGTPEIRLALIKYLQQHYRITDVCMEIGHAAAWLYNGYLETGDTTLFTSPLLALAGKQPNREFWKQLYKFNLGLYPRIQIHGYDFERMEFLKVLKMLMPGDIEKPEKIAATLNYISSAQVANVNNDTLKAIYKAIRENMDSNMDLYGQYYGEQYALVQNIMFNNNTEERYPARNEEMFWNVMTELENDGVKRFLVIAGMNHADNSDPNSMCSRLKQQKEFKDKVVTIAMVCKNCFDLQLPSGNEPIPFRGPRTYEKDITLMDGIYKRFCNLATWYPLIATKLIGAETPMIFSDYIILLKDQPVY